MGFKRQLGVKDKTQALKLKIMESDLHYRNQPVMNNKFVRYQAWTNKSQCHWHTIEYDSRNRFVGGH